MDPNAALAELRLIMGQADDAGERPLRRAVALFGALDDWLTRGGFLPDAWDHAECGSCAPDSDGCVCRLGPDCPRPGKCDDSAVAEGAND